jgi:acyl carrier protein
METASTAEAPVASLRDEVQAVVKEIIASIKMLPEGPDAVSEDALLFNDGLNEPSPLDLDSLDALDLALALKERFDPEGDRFEAFMNGDVDIQELSTVRKITDYVLSLASPSDVDRLASRMNGPADIQASVRSSE